MVMIFIEIVYQVVTLETRVKYDKGLVEATGSQTEVELKIN